MSHPAPADSPQQSRLSFQQAYSILLGRELALGENPMHCFCHEDAARSCSVNTENGAWICYATGNKGWLLQAVQTVRGCSVAEAKAQLLAWGIPMNGSRQPRAAKVWVTDPPAVDGGEDLAEAYARTLQESRVGLEFLTGRLGFSAATVERFQLGWWEKNDAWTVPIRNERGEVCNIKKHFPFRDPDSDAPKSVGIGGHNAAYLWPIDVLACENIIVCEGEKDCITLSQHLPAEGGWGAVTATLGAETWNPGLNERFAGRRVVVIYDCDRAGRDGAAKVAAELSGVAADVAVVDLGLDDKGDLWDYFDAGGSWQGLEVLIKSARKELASPAATPSTAVLGADVVPITSAPRHWLADVLDDKQRPVPSLFGSKFVREWPLAMSGGWLYRYDWDRGVYVDDGEDWVAQRIKDLLGPLWKSRVHSELTHWLRIEASVRQLWDPPPRHIINCTNGLLNVRTRVLLEHSPDHLSPVQIPVTYDPAARCPEVERFLSEALTVGDDEVYYEICGITLVPVVEYHRMFMFVGPGGGGKSTALKLAVSLVGERNRSTLPLHAIADDKFATADLLGKLMNVCADVDSTDLRQTGVLKQITGGDSIRAQFKNRQPFTFSPFARLLFSANDPPATSDATQAFYRRFLIIPFTHRFEKPDRDIDRKLQRASELSGLLNHALDGLDRLTKQGEFTKTESITTAFELFQTETSTVRMFCREHVEVEADARVGQKALFENFREWSRENNQGTGIAARTFNKQLKEMYPHLSNPEYVKGNGTVKVKGYPHWPELKYVLAKHDGEAEEQTFADDDAPF